MCSCVDSKVSSCTMEEFEVTEVSISKQCLDQDLSCQSDLAGTRTFRILCMDSLMLNKQNIFLQLNQNVYPPLFVHELIENHKTKDLKYLVRFSLGDEDYINESELFVRCEGETLKLKIKTVE